MYKEGLALSYLQVLISRKSQLNQIIYIQYICIKRIWHEITYTGWYAIKPTQPNKTVITTLIQTIEASSLDEI